MFMSGSLFIRAIFYGLPPSNASFSQCGCAVNTVRAKRGFNRIKRQRRFGASQNHSAYIEFQQRLNSFLNERSTVQSVTSLDPLNARQNQGIHDCFFWQNNCISRSMECWIKNLGRQSSACADHTDF